MAKTKGVCKLFAQSDENFTKDLELNKVFDFEMEYLEAQKQNGYYIIVSPTETKKMLESSFLKFFKVKPAEAELPKEKKVVEVKENAAHSTDSIQKNAELSGPKGEKPQASKGSESESILQGWNEYEHLINSITLRPFDGKSGMVNVIVNIKPDIDLTMTGPASNVFGGILQSLSKLTTLEGKIADLVKIIDERTKLEVNKKADAEKKVEKTDTTKTEAAKPDTKADKKGKGLEDKKPVQATMEMGVAAPSQEMNGEPTANPDDWEDKDPDGKGEGNGDGSASDIDQW